MPKLTRLCLAFALLTATAQAAPTFPGWNSPAQPPRKTLTAFANDAELAAWLEKARPVRQRAHSMDMQMAPATAGAPPPPPAPMPAQAAPAVGNAMGSMALAKDSKAEKSAGEAESVTNTQTAGVDEGGIVKVHGDHLVILRRGRLFTVAVGSGNLQPVSIADAYGPGASPSGAWYDEMLIAGDRIAVIGYSYQRGGTEVGLFDISRGGQLAHRGTYHLRSNDYYSSRNYASRLIGNKLIFYTPLQIGTNSDPFAGFPAMRKWRDGALPSEFKRLAPATRVYRTDEQLPEYGGAVLHSVTTCDLAKAEMSCEATAVLGPAGRVFYVSNSSVYVWTSAYNRGNGQVQTKSGVFRIPLDGSAPTALKVAGAPTDQFSFLESPDGFLNVLVRSQGRGDAMWAGESGGGEVALLRAPLSSFSDGRDTAPASAYKVLPKPNNGALQNRFIGNFLVYGSGNTWNNQRDAWGNAQFNNLFAVRWDNNAPVQTLPITHSVDRIEALGQHAVIVGTAGPNLYFSSLRLDREAQPAYRFTRANAAQGETRSHGFFYKPESEDNGTVGLPIVGGGRAGNRQLRENSAAVLYLRNQSLQLEELGALESRGGQVNDGCRASCVDWYGNARPLFLKNRVFAPMGYELVEGRVANSSISEVARVSFAPDGRGMLR
jgi:hypothetical protein